MVSLKPTSVNSKKEISLKSKPSINKKGKAVKKVKKMVPVPIPSLINETITSKSLGNAGEVPKRKIKYIMPSKAITGNLVELSLQALDKLMTQQNNKNIIFGDETSVFLEIRHIKIQNTRGNIKFVLPHSTVSSSGEICLITPDIKKGRKPDHEPTIEHWEEILRKAGVTEVKTVLPMRQLRVEYDQFELKRRLLTQHDFIMVDTRVLNHVSHLLGKMFFKKHNMLIPVKINENGDIKKDISIGLRTTMLRLSEGDTSCFLVGHTSMPHNKLKENILSFIQQLNNKFPGGELNIRSISLKLPLSLALPLYLTLRPSNSVAPPKLNKCKPKGFVEIEDELSTIPGSRVRVAPDGTVLLKKTGKKNYDSASEEETDKQDIKKNYNIKE